MTGTDCKTNSADLIPEGETFITVGAFKPNSRSESNEGYSYGGPEEPTQTPTEEHEEPWEPTQTTTEQPWEPADLKEPEKPPGYG